MLPLFKFCVNLAPHRIWNQLVMVVVVSARSKERTNKKPNHALSKNFTEFSSIVSTLQRNRHEGELEHGVLGLKLTVALL